MRYVASGAAAILDEMKLHVRLSAEWGASETDLEQATEARATIAYTRFVLDAGMRGDLLDLLTALAPCVIGYAEIGATWAKAPRGLAQDNPYRGWIAEYSGGAYQQVGADARAALDRLAATLLSEGRYPRLLEIFRQATRLEADFWQMGLDCAE
jgi:thiaminase/transcriptional activator TenA